MSVIHDALKTAQRQKQSRQGSPAGGAPILPGRAYGGGKPFDWKNAATIAGASIVIIVALGTLWVRMSNLRPKPAENIPVVMVPADISPAGPVAQAPRVAASVPAPAAPEAVPSDEPAVRQQSPVQPRRATATAPAPRPSSETIIRAPAAAAPAEEAPSENPTQAQAGRLRIAVEQPREGDAARLFAAGVAAHRAGDLPAARSAYERVLGFAPNDVDALNNLGVLLAAQRELERGEALLRRAVALAPGHVGAWNNLGSVLAQRGQSGDAIAAYEQALSLDPQHFGARVSLAQQHLAIGASGKAREELAVVIAANPSMAEAHYALGQAYELEKDWAGAVRAYSAFVNVAPPRLSSVAERVRERIQMLGARTR